jgi:hypothetical protein
VRRTPKVWHERDSQTNASPARHPGAQTRSTTRSARTRVSSSDTRSTSPR